MIEPSGLPAYGYLSPPLNDSHGVTQPVATAAGLEN